MMMTRMFSDDRGFPREKSGEIGSVNVIVTILMGLYVLLKDIDEEEIAPNSKEIRLLGRIYMSSGERVADL